MHIALVSLFPEMFEAVTDHGVTGRAVKQGLVEISHSNPRDYTTDRHRTVDDRPYGGGPGMLMKIDPLQQAIAAARETAGENARVIYLSPQGKRLDHARSVTLSEEQALILVAGRYEGPDERVIELETDLAKTVETSQVLVDHVNSLEAQLASRSDTERFLATKIATLDEKLKQTETVKAESETRYSTEKSQLATESGMA